MYPQNRAVGYASVRALDRIADPEFARQAATIKQFCAHRGLEVVALERDLESRNGRGSGRPSLAHAIELLRAGDASCLVVAELKDLCPSVAELGEILAVIDRADARLISLDPAIDTGTPYGRAVARVVTSISEWERARRAERTSAARARVAVLPTIPPEVRRRIVRMRGAGMTLQAIADELNDAGVATVRGGAKWRPSSVQGALGYKRPRPWLVPSETEEPERGEGSRWGTA
jgi:DNA invertase Pin-like site-specific DNA recombinase